MGKGGTHDLVFDDDKVPGFQLDVNGDGTSEELKLDLKPGSTPTTARSRATARRWRARSPSSERPRRRPTGTGEPSGTSTRSAPGAASMRAGSGPMRSPLP